MRLASIDISKFTIGSTLYLLPGIELTGVHFNLRIMLIRHINFFFHFKSVLQHFYYSFFFLFQQLRKFKRPEKKGTEVSKFHCPITKIAWYLYIILDLLRAFCQFWPISCEYDKKSIYYHYEKYNCIILKQN